MTACRSSTTAVAVAVVFVSGTIAIVVALFARKYLAPPALRRHSAFAHTHFCSGDLLLWSTPPGAAWYIDAQKLLCASPYTHASMVFVDADRVPWVWESVVATGHRLVRLEALLVARPCTLRKLNQPLDAARLERFIRENIASKYSYSLWEAVVHQWVPVGTAPSSSSQEQRRRRFCSQLVADTYDALGAVSLALSPKADSALVLPADFAFPRDRDALHWLAPYALGPEIHITL